MNTKIITRVGYLIIVIVVFGVLQSYTSNKIVGNEIIREEHDYQMLSDVQNIFNEALKENDVKEYVYNWIGNKENCRWTIGECKDDFMTNIENFYDVFYKNMNINDLQKINFLSISCRKKGVVYVFINKNLEVKVTVQDENKIIEEQYINKNMVLE